MGAYRSRGGTARSNGSNEGVTQSFIGRVISDPTDFYAPIDHIKKANENLPFSIIMWKNMKNRAGTCFLPQDMIYC